MTNAWYQRVVRLLVTWLCLGSAMAWAQAPLAQPGAVVWPLEATSPRGQQLSRDTQGPLVDVLKAAGDLGQVNLALPPNERVPEKVIQAGRSYNAALLIGGSLVVAGERVTATLTLQDTVSGEVLAVVSASGDQSQAVPLIEGLANGLVQRWQSGELKPHVVDLGQGLAALRLDTVPTGANLELDGRELGQAPLLVRGVAPGMHQVSAVLRETITIDTLQAVTSPAGLRLQLDARSPAVSPVSVNDLAEGGHTLTFLGDTPPRQVGLNVLSTPAGGLVSWDDRQLGETPLTITLKDQDVKLGTHRLSVMGRPLFGAVASVLVAGAERVERRLALDRFAKIIVTASPPDAQVALDGEPMGNVPLSLHVHAGKHEVTISRTTYNPEVQEVAVAAGGIVDVRAELQPAHQGDGTVLPLPTADVVKGLSVTPFLLGFGRSNEGRPMSWVGLTTSYGWPRAIDVWGWPLGVALGGGLGRADGDTSAVWASAGGKLQLVEQGDAFPVSAAVGVWGQGPTEPNWQGYVALSRQMADFTFHIGVATGGLSISAGYHRWPHWILSGSAYLDYGLLRNVGAGTVPMFGVRAGYVL